jgi:hypothetical protein
MPPGTPKPAKPTDREAAPRRRASQADTQAEKPDVLDPEPPRVDTVPGSMDKFEQAVGRAITNWQEVEEALSALFVKTSTCDNLDVARAIYWTIHDFSDKLNIVRNAARLVLDEDALRRFETLRRQLINASNSRNAIAHYHIVFYGLAPGRGDIQIRHEGEEETASPDNINHKVTLEIRLMPNLRDPNLRFKPDKGGKPGWMNTVQIRNASTNFLKLARMIDQLTANIPPVRELPEEGRT